MPTWGDRRRAARGVGAMCALLAILVASCAPAASSGGGGQAAPVVPVLQSGTEKFFIFPDSGLTPLLDFVDGADRTLDAYVFVLANRTIEARFVDAVKRGVAVRVILEPNPSGRADEQKDVYDRLR